MATIVCQNQLIEPSRTLRLKLSSPNPNPNPLLSSQSLQLAIKSCFLPPKEPKQESVSNGNWGCLQFPETEEAYVHPLLKRPLSRHSLEMCTENLGSETGSDDGVFSIPSPSPSPSPKKQRQVSGRTGTAGRTLPPPLTTISGSECVRIETRRQGGRMVMEAVKGPSTNTCFRSERTHGRLRLYICSAPPETQTRDCDVDSGRGDFVADPVRGSENLEEDGGVWSVSGGEGVSGDNLKVRGKMGNEVLQMPSRCKEGCEKWEGCRALTTS